MRLAHGFLHYASPRMISIAVDAMGGDEGPATVVAGISLSAKKNPDIGFILHGPKDQLEPLVAKRRATCSPIAEAPPMIKTPRLTMRYSPSLTFCASRNCNRWYEACEPRLSTHLRHSEAAQSFGLYVKVFTIP
mgnify:CR=1 FL=1